MATDLFVDEEKGAYAKGAAPVSTGTAREAPRAGLSQGQATHWAERRWLAWALPLGLFVAALAPRLLGLDAFLTADEDDQLRFAAGFLTAVLAGNWEKAVLLGYPGVPTMALAGCGLAARYLLYRWGWAPLPAAGADLASTLAHVTRHPLDYIQAARLPMVLVASLAVVGMYLLMRRLLDRRIALLAALLIAFDPFFLANSRIVHVDAPLTYFMFLSFLAFLLFLKEERWGWLVVSGVAGALATLSKTPGAILGPILVVAGLIYVLRPAAESPPGSAARRWRRFVLSLALWGVVAAAAFYALWPSMWTDPGRAVSLIVNNLRIAINTAHPSSGVFWGPTGSDRNPLYYLISLPFRLSPLATLGLAAAAVATWRLRRYRPLLLSLWAYVALFLIPVSLVGRRGDRYILPVYPAVDLLAAIALCWLAQRLAGAGWTRLRGRWERVVGVLLAAQVAFVLSFHPYYFSYLNPLLGGPLSAPRLINIGWGEGLDRAAAYLNGRPDASQKTVAVWYSYQFAPFFHGRSVDLSSNEPALTADYNVFYINQVQRGFPSQEIVTYFKDRRPLHTVRLGGVEYAWIYPGPVISDLAPVGVQRPVETVLGGAVRLIGYDVSQETIAADDELFVTLYWQALAPIRRDYNVYVRLVDSVGNVWGQVDRLPLGGLWRTNQWQPGIYIRDEYKITPRPGAPPGRYDLEVAMYSFETGQTFGVARNLGQVALAPAHRMPGPKDLDMQNTLRMSLAPGLELMGYDLGAHRVGPGERLPVTLYWRATRRIDADYQVSLNAKSVAGNEGGGWLDRLASEDYPTSRWRLGEIVVDVHQLQMPPSARSGFYVLNMRLIDAATDSDASQRLILGKIEFIERARRFDTPQVQFPVGIDLGGKVHLIGFNLPQAQVAPGRPFPLTLYWRALSQMDTSYTVFVHAVGPDGVIRGQWDSVPGAGALPTTGWLEGEVIQDEYLIPMEEDAPAWQYTLLVGLYDPATNQRLLLTGSEDRDSIGLTMIRVEQAE